MENEKSSLSADIKRKFKEHGYINNNGELDTRKLE